MELSNLGVVDLFCGIGGLSHGFFKEGIPILAGIDIDDSCKYAFEVNNKSKFLSKSITEVESKELNDIYDESNIKTKILVGCAPCQPFSSYTFKHKEKKVEKWGLLYDFIRLIKDVKPEIVSMENVPQLLNFNKAPIFDDFVNELMRLGYHVSYSIVYCPDYGIPQNRRRLVLFASLLGELNIINKTHNSKNYRTVRHAIGHLNKINDGEQDKKDLLHISRKLTKLNKERIQNTPYGGSWSDWDENLKLDCHKKDSGKSYSSVYGRMVWDEPSPTITTHCIGYGNGRFGHPVQDRGISLREAALLQTFPKSYKFYDKTNLFSSVKIAKQIGNAVPVDLGKVIAKSIKKHLKEIYEN